MAAVPAGRPDNGIDGLVEDRTRQSTQGPLMAKAHIAGADAPVSVAEALRAGLSRWSGRLLAETALLYKALPDSTPQETESVHHARTAIRRLRVILSYSEKLAVPRSANELERLRKELSWLGRSLGRVRDLDVMAEHVVRLSELDPVVDVRALCAEIETRRRLAYSKLLEDLASHRFSRLSSRLTSTPKDASFRKRGRKEAPEVITSLVGHAFARLEKIATKAASRPSPSRLHAVRIAAKRCRYTAELADPFLGVPASSFAKCMADLQDLLGIHHDMAVLLTWLDEAATSDAPGEEQKVRLVAERAKLESARIEASWHETWKRCRSPETLRWLRK